MARRPDLESFARQHKLKIGTIADLIRYRLRQERSVERIAEQQVTTEFGDFKLLAYEDHVHKDVHLALVRGTLDANQPPLVRVHPIDTLADIIGLRDAGRTWTLRQAMQRIAEVGTGVVIVLRDHTTPRELADAVTALGQRAGHVTPVHAPPQVLRTYGIGAQILKDLGITRMQVLSAPKQLQGIAAFGLEITGYVAD
jgi:3,4-dihydroxy 2-butanone 4-phosphate synthase/GTP cyclohydrolase II